MKKKEVFVNARQYGKTDYNSFILEKLLEAQVLLDAAKVPEPHHLYISGQWHRRVDKRWSPVDDINEEEL